MNNNVQEYDDGDLYDDTALRREDEAEAYKQARLRELDKQLDAKLEQIRLSKDERTLQEWAEDELVKKFDITQVQALTIVEAEVREWEIARIPFDWQRPVNKASRFMRSLALYSSQEQYKKWRRANPPAADE